MFWHSTPRDKWPTDYESLRNIEKLSEGPFGDMRQELVFIGQGLDQQAMTEALDECLLTEYELVKGKQYWLSLNDPFPAWTDE